ncbi:PD-(D/E)XK nuclease domain-containing protein, partial [Methanospirillum hungatei]|uniref:PD-(D/E)XK nuclease domain-containing protein n=1 Tax=Methanospirillum hungatei TaxID=2203 RepID=UPI002C9A407B
EYIHEFDKDKVREWYNGYSWTGERVYNPFDILLLFSKGIFRPYWFETGTPRFLIELWKNAPRLPAEFDGMVVGDEILGSFDPEQIRVETLLFQAGYLTIHSWESNPDIGTWYTLGFPNREVRESFNRMILSILGPDTPNISVPAYRTILESGDAEGLRTRIQALFASIPHDWYRKNPISQYEGYYASVFYAWLSSLGFTVIPEDVTNKGRIDLSVQAGLITWIFEFKIHGIDLSGDRNPLDQIKNQGYAEKYLAESKQVILVGIVWNPKIRNIEQWDVATE